MVQFVRAYLAPFLAFIFSVSGCTAEKISETGLKRGTVTINGKAISVEIADTPETRRQGLMNRAELAPNSGMLFVFERDDIHSFWMRNTSIPLDIAFIDREGIITDIRRMEPFDERTRHRPSRAVRYALEVQMGWFHTRGIGPGDKVDLSDLLRESM